MKDNLTANERDFALDQVLVEMMVSDLADRLDNSMEVEKETPTVLVLEVR